MYAVLERWVYKENSFNQMYHSVIELSLLSTQTSQKHSKIQNVQIGGVVLFGVSRIRWTRPSCSSICSGEADR